MTTFAHVIGWLPTSSFLHPWSLLTLSCSLPALLMNRLWGTVTESRSLGLASSLFSSIQTSHLLIHSVSLTASFGMSCILPARLCIIAAQGELLAMLPKSIR